MTTLNADHRPITALAETESGYLISGSGNTIYMWDITQSEPVATFSVGRSTIETLVSLPKGFAVVTDDGFKKGMCIYDLEANTTTTMVGAEAITALTLLDDRIAIGFSHGTILYWSTKPEALSFHDIKSLADELGKNTSVSRINLQNVGMDLPDALPWLQKVFGKNTTIEELDLRKTGFSRLSDKDLQCLYDSTLTRSPPLQIHHEAMPRIKKATDQAKTAAAASLRPSVPSGAAQLLTANSGYMVPLDSTPSATATRDSVAPTQP